jgi:NADH-quinone oxidoreductase subunit D
MAGTSSYHVRRADAAVLMRPRPEAVIGDCWHRFYVRMREVAEAVKIARQAMDRYDALHAEGEQAKAEFAARRPSLTTDAAKADDAKLAELMRTKYSHRVEPPKHSAGRRGVPVETECPRGQMGFHVVGRPAKENGAAAGAGAVEQLRQPVA